MRGTLGRRSRRGGPLPGYGGVGLGDLSSRRPLPVGRILAGVALVLFLLLVQVVRPLPSVEATNALGGPVAAKGTPPSLPWPAKGSAAVGVSGLGLLGESNPDVQPRPIASVAKVMTAVATLDARPLQVAQPGPSIEITADDVAVRERREAEGESTVPVAAGTSLTQRQALEALLIPSGNNVGEILGRWIAGSPEAFVAQMNAKAEELGLEHTHFDDVSGVAAGTVSTPRDLVKLALVAMQNPVIAEIVPMPQATLPVAGIVYNVNSILGQERIFGIKTGYTSSAGACFMFASRHQVDGRPVTIVGAVMGQDTLADAFEASKALIRAVRPGLVVQPLVAEGQKVARYQAPWGAGVDVVTSKAVVAVGWPGREVKTRLRIDPVQGAVAAGAGVGTLTVSFGGVTEEVPLVTADALPPPGRGWRLLRSG
jgi:D-alanyl-D-alanine carboxypeptidase (penicillin-binding protein 5/6)